MAMLLNSNKLTYQQPKKEEHPVVHGLSNQSSIKTHARVYEQINGILNSDIVVSAKAKRVF